MAIPLYGRTPLISSHSFAQVDTTPLLQVRLCLDRLSIAIYLDSDVQMRRRIERVIMEDILARHQTFSSLSTLLLSTFRPTR